MEMEMEDVHHNQHPSHDHHHHHLSSSFNQEPVVVIMVPFPSQSHLNQLLQISCLISTTSNIPIHYAGWDTQIHLAKQRFNGGSGINNNNIHFHEFPPPPPPPPSNSNPINSSTSNFPWPPFEFTLHLRQPVAALLHKISPTATRVIVIHDVLTAYVLQDSATLPNVECYTFIPNSALCSFFEGWQMMRKPFQERQREDEPKGLPSLQGCMAPGIVNFVTRHADFAKNRSGIIFNSCRSIEGPYIDLLAKEQNSENQQLWAIGPLNLLTTTVCGDDESRRNYSNSCCSSQHKYCLEWLDKQAPNSVLYVSFGTTISMTDEQIKELAMGLEQSKQKFIWVLRDANNNTFVGDVMRTELPEGYEERVKEDGMVMRGWAPQLEILGHPSTGGFMSHCGWNSCLESIAMGVPIASWPMHFDQPKNAFLITDILKVGVAVKQRAPREELVTSSAIAKAVKRLMASKEGEEMRKKAEELGGATRQSVKEGGASRMELDSFIAHIST